MSCLTPERKSGESLQAPGVSEKMLIRVPAAGEEQSWKQSWVF